MRHFMMLSVAFTFVFGLAFSVNAQYDVAESLDTPLLVVDISLPDTTGRYNQTLSIPVRAKDIASGIHAVEMIISYDGDLLSFDSVGTVGTLVSDWMMDYNTFKGVGTPIDTVLIAAAGDTSSLSGDGDLLFLQFLVADRRTPASCALTFEDFLFNDGEIEHTTVNGSFTLLGVDATAEVAPDTIYAGDTVTVTVGDVDENRDVESMEQVYGKAENRRTGEEERVSLIETGATSGVFVGSLSTVYGTIAGANNDGALSVGVGDTVEISYIDSLDGEGTSDTVYAWVQVTGGETGEVLSSRVIQPGDTVRVKVMDGDENLNSGAIEDVSITVRNLRSGESETVTLTETGADSATFRGWLSTLYGVAANPSTGVMNVVGGDTLVVEYVDALSWAGRNVVLRDTTLVVTLFGDVTGNGRAGAYDASLILQKKVGYIVLPDPNWPNFTVEVGDVTGDGRLAPLDASYVLQYVVRKIQSFPVQTQEIPKPVFGERTVWLERAREEILRVKVDELGGILAGEMELGFDASKVRVIEVRTTDWTEGYLLAWRVDDACVRIAFAGDGWKVGEGSLVEIRVEPLGEGKSSSIRLDRVVLNEERMRVRLMDAEVDLIVFPGEYHLHPNYPNPFNPRTTITHDVPRSGTVQLFVYSLTGQRIRTLVDGNRPAGSYSVVWDGTGETGRDVASGVYMCRMVAGEYSAMRKLVLVR